MKPLITLLLTLNLFVSSFLLYSHYKPTNQIKETEQTITAIPLQDAVKVASDAKKEAIRQSWTIILRPKIRTLPALRVGEVITPETKALLLAREQQAFDTILAWDVAQEKTEKALDSARR